MEFSVAMSKMKSMALVNVEAHLHAITPLTEGVQNITKEFAVICVEGNEVLDNFGNISYEDQEKSRT